jgi:hypothetical protein
MNSKVYCKFEHTYSCSYVRTGVLQSTFFRFEKAIFKQALNLSEIRENVFIKVLVKWQYFKILHFVELVSQTRGKH